MGDLGPISFDIKTPMERATLQRQVSNAIGRHLPEADGAELPALTVVANGPSARGRVFSGPTLALNGALSLFPLESPPTMWAACDPQALVAQFLYPAPMQTGYYVASKCHPTVFDRLAGHDVRVWHVNDADVDGRRTVPCATSITLTALMLMHRLGYRKFDIWGWDCCYADDGAHHAGTGFGSEIEPVRLDVGDRTFITSETWGAELNDAMQIIPVLEWCGAEINIHGDGMLNAVRNYKRDQLLKAA